MLKKELRAKIKEWQLQGLSRLDRAELIKAYSDNGDIEALLRYNDKHEETKASSLDYNFTDAGNGEAVAAEWQHQLRYVFEWKSWVIYKKGRWGIDTTGEVKDMVVKTMRRLYCDCVNMVSLEDRKNASKYYIASENDKRVASILNMTIPQPGISITANQLDNQPWLLNVRNGTLDLRTGELRQADSNDLLTQQIDINYNPEATTDEWEAFLLTIFNNDVELIDFTQRGVGFSLNGTQLERVFFFLCGLGMNGKSALMAALRQVLVPYAMEAKPELFMEKKFAGSGPDEGQAALKGIRLLTATEVKRNQNLDVSLVKRMTGGEPIWHERKFQHGYSYQPTHTLWLSGNHEPRIKDTTDSIWDRFNKIPFEVRIPANKEIKGYGEKLAEKYGEAILNWCIKGAMAYNERGLGDKPECVLLANAEYRASQDALHDFIEVCISKSLDNTLASEVYEAYKDFSQTDDVDPMGKKYFNEAMRERGFRDKRGNYNKPVWVGVALSGGKVTNLVSNVTNVTEKQESFPREPLTRELSGKTVTKVTKVTEGTPEYPTKACHACGGTDYWMDSAGQYICCQCHLEPGEKEE